MRHFSFLSAITTPTKYWILRAVAAFLLLSAMNCKDPKDHRIPERSTVIVKFVPIDPEVKSSLRINAFTIGETKLDPTKFKQEYNYQFALDPNQDIFQVTIQYDDSQTATLTINYKCRAFLISPERGAAWQYILTGAVSTFGRQPKILKKKLQNFLPKYEQDQPNVQVYF